MLKNNAIPKLLSHESLICIGLFVLSAGTALFYAMLDPYLHLWDEQYHALVAKRMAENPLKPMLYDTMLRAHDLHNWIDAHFWLHKQPFFLWLMALSIKLLGPTTLAVRLPSVLLHGLMAPMIYRMGVLSRIPRAGMVAALLFSCAYYPLELLSGYYATDHNDLCFIAMVTASFWAWFEYQRQPSKKWAVIIGVLAGAAILTKWLTGLLVFGGWGASILFTRSWPELKDWTTGLLVSIVTFLPWQLFILWRYPVISKHEFGLNSRHFFEVVESHSGNAFFHWDAMQMLYGTGALVPYLVVASLVLIVWKLESLKAKIFIGSTVLATYIFFSIAATKMTTFTMVVGALIFLALGHLVASFGQLLERFIPKVLSLLVIAGITAAICVMYFDYPAVQHKRDLSRPDLNGGRAKELREIEFIKSIQLPKSDEHYAVFNANTTSYGNIAYLFHRDFAVAYVEYPTEENLKMARALNLDIVVIDMTGSLPAEFYDNPEMTILKAEGFLDP